MIRFTTPAPPSHRTGLATRRPAARAGRLKSWALLGLVALALWPANVNGQQPPGTGSATIGALLGVVGPIGQNVRLCLGQQTCEVGDVDGDGRADLVVFVHETRGQAQAGDVWVALSRGGWFARPERWLSQFCLGNQECTLADLNGRQNNRIMADLVAFVKSSRGDDQLGQVMVAISTGHSFQAPQAAYSVNNSERSDLVFCIGNEICRVGDLNADGNADLVAFTRDTDPRHRGSVYMARSQIAAADDAPAVFEQPRLIKTFFCIAEEECAVGNVDQDGGDDLVAFVRDTQADSAKNDVWVYPTTDLSAADTAEAQLWHNTFCKLNQQCLVANIDGAGGDDLIAFGVTERDGTLVSTMYVSLAGSGRFGAAEYTYEGAICPANDICRLGDVDNDGGLDVVAFDRGADPRVCAGNVTVTYVLPTAAGSRARSNTAFAATSQFLPMITTPPPVFCP